MRIAHALGWYFPGNIGGTEVYVAGLIRRLRAAGHESVVIAPDVDGDSTCDHEGTRVERYRIPARPTRDEAQGLVKVRGAERFDAIVERWQPDILHIHSFVTGLGLFEIGAARTVGAQIVATHHLPSLGYVCRTGTLMQWGSTPCDGVCEAAKCAACASHVRGVPAVAAKALAALPMSMSRALGVLPGPAGTMLGLPASIATNQDMQRRFARITDRMVVLNDAARRMLIANGASPAKIVLNRLGISHPSVTVKPQRRTSSPVRFGFIGRLHPTKGIDTIASALRSIRADVKFTLDIRGPEPEEADRPLVTTIRRMVADDTRISFGGPVTYDEVPAVLASYDVLCCPSTGFEHGPTVALEAMAVGTPVIGTRLGNLAELIEDGRTGLLFTPGDAAALADAIVELAQQPAIVDRWRAALPRVRTMDEIAADYMRLYQELLRERAVA